ncbi:MAG: electron transport complex subunit RsxC [Oscillospiraceae bacterium]
MLKKLKREARGVEIPSRKITASLATVPMPIPKKIVLLMKQHIGAPCVPVVAKGDLVEVGTLVGKAQGLGADIHSGVSGKVSKISKITTAENQLVEAVEIVADGRQTIAASVLPPIVRDRESFLEAVRASGIVGLGGAGFPTAVKLNPPKGTKVDTLIINAAECEPYITSDDREMLECGNFILSGITTARKYLDIERVIIAIERNKPDATELMFSLTKGDPGLVVAPLDTNYPQGAEKVLIETVTGRLVPEDKIPADVGVIMMNVATVSAIGKYLASGMPLVTRRITVDGGAVVEPKNVEAIVGTPVADVIDFCGGYKTPPAKLITGGPLMGVALATDAYPVVKVNNAILAFARREAALPLPEPCMRCGRCVYACPMGLSPIEICEAYELEDMDMLERLSSNICISCGVCSYVCPAKRLVSQTCTQAKQYYQRGAVKK